ncbi:MAG: signal recognition particle protein [Bacilli bacterium]|nr:signal recognition particle protein [Bacilli bacterium]
MPFESLSERLQMSLRRITGRGKLNENDIDEMMKEVRLSLLEADVNYKVVKSFCADVKEKALGEKIMKSLTPGDQVVKVVHDELKKLMGDEAVEVKYRASGPSIFMLVGLQGAGKTTHVGKLAAYLRKKDKKRPLLIAGDIYRPAAIDQLKTVGKQLGIEVFDMGNKEKVTTIVSEGIKYAKKMNNDLIIIDTAGRLHIDEALMKELQDINELCHPDEILLTIDAMMGQDAINVITTFNEMLPLTGCILTKLDGDTRGGAALSIRYLTNVPIKYIGVGEKLDQIELFHPDRMAGRILGMGDVVSFIEKATDAIDEDEAMKMVEKMQKGVFNYNDFLKQLKWIKRMGSLKSLLGMIPGVGSQIKNIDIDDKQLVYINAIISSMTEEERKKPDLIATSPSRRERVSKGSGRSYQEVNSLVKRFEDMKKQMKAMSGMSEADMQRSMQTGQGMPKQKVKKGKGKGRGNFRF